MLNNDDFDFVLDIKGDSEHEIAPLSCSLITAMIGWTTAAAGCFAGSQNNCGVRPPLQGCSWF